MNTYPVANLYREVSFIAYYFHWPYEEIMQLDHEERRRWCKEISRINRDLNDEGENIFDV